MQVEAGTSAVFQITYYFYRNHEMSIYTRGTMEIVNIALVVWKIVNFFLIMQWLVLGCHNHQLLAFHVFMLSYDILNRLSQAIDGLVSFVV